MHGTPATRVTLYDAPALETVIAGMARRAAGLLAGSGSAIVVGIRRRGVPLARLIATRLASDFGIRLPPIVELDIKRYADDLTLLHPQPRLTEDPAHPLPDLRGATVLVVDDVMYQGHSMLRAVEHLACRQPAWIRTMVLVDRDVARLPIRTDVVGVRLDVAPGDVIECHVPPYEAELGIALVRPPR